ncbi:transmembrane transporter [Mycolicibacterium conceptionense]|uniref:Transmembrane transporter n=1 Tax=Mycolicibacterium conceptionense TaxID=451644 RepID=A0A0U1DT46_9MYCO|nr:transmembrane transporter [Mycolicibacterium conceptionense]
MSGTLRDETRNNYEHDLELELDGAVEVRPGAMAAGGALLVVAVT